MPCMVIAKQVVILGPLTVMHATRFADLEYFFSCLHAVVETAVAPPVGAWIETRSWRMVLHSAAVAPPMCTWIETSPFCPVTIARQPRPASQPIHAKPGLVPLFEVQPPAADGRAERSDYCRSSPRRPFALELKAALARVGLVGAHDGERVLVQHRIVLQSIVLGGRAGVFDAVLRRGLNEAGSPSFTACIHVGEICCGSDDALRTHPSPAAHPYTHTSQSAPDTQ